RQCSPTATSCSALHREFTSEPPRRGSTLSDSDPALGSLRSRGVSPMRMLVVALVLALIPLVVATAGDDAKPITPEAAAKKVNEKCTVEMKVASVVKGKEVYFLNSKEDF